MTYQRTNSELFDGDETDLIVAVTELREEIAELREENRSIKVRIEEVAKGSLP
jgi:hypothetical protein